MTAYDQPAHLLTDPGWFPDPREEHHLRYFDGAEWTDHVTHRGPEPCSGCYAEINGTGPLTAVRAVIEEQRRAVRSPARDVSRQRRAPDRRRVRGREDASDR